MEEKPSTRILTLPNLITLLRLAGIPVFVWLLFGPERDIPAAFLLGGLGATDWVDGFLARRLNQTSELGRILDPTVDRLLILTAIVSLLLADSIPVAFAWVSLVREVVVALGVLVLFFMGVDSVQVKWSGKTGALALMCSFPLFLFSYGDLDYHQGFQNALEISAWVFGIGGLAFSYYAVLEYIPQVRAQLKGSS